MNQNKIHLPLFWKFTIAIIFVVAIFGSINYYFINKALQNLSHTEINRHGLSIAKSVSERSIDPILFDDISYLDKMVSDHKKIDDGIAYILIFDKNNDLIAHSFENTIPQEVIDLNRIDFSNEVSVRRIMDHEKESNVIRNFKMPIFNGNLGTIGIGIYEQNFTNSIKSINNFFLSMVFLFLLIGIIGALLFSYIITFPIKRISNISENLNLKSINKSSKEVSSGKQFLSLAKLKGKLKIRDEIDVLNNRFNHMVIRLQKTYEELQYTQASLMQSEKMASLGTLSAGVAHEINNPISGIQNCIRRLEKSPDNIKQNILYLELMADAVDKIETVVTGLLNFSRKNDFNFEKNSLNEKIENVLFLASYELEKSQIAVKKEYKNHNYFVYASSNHIEQVLLNLILNSIDAINEKKQTKTNYFGEIVFDIIEFENDIVFSISDNGIGVSSDKLNSIFDPFFTQKKIKKGTGLGLTVCYSIIEQHGGNITASINSNLGLTIKVKLPKKKEQDG